MSAGPGIRLPGSDTAALAQVRASARAVSPGASAAPAAQEAGQQRVAGAHAAARGGDRGFTGDRAGVGHQDRAVRAEAGQHGLGAPGPERLRGVHHVPDGLDLAADSGGELVPVGLDQRGAGLDRASRAGPLVSTATFTPRSAQRRHRSA